MIDVSDTCAECRSREASHGYVVVLGLAIRPDTCRLYWPRRRGLLAGMFGLGVWSGECRVRSVAVVVGGPTLGGPGRRRAQSDGTSAS